jgi:glycosyltransferase involved in cell wall biosynthesis
MIEVLHLIDTYRIGGPGKTIINSARYIDRSRYRVHVGAFTAIDERRNEFAHAVRTAGIPFLELRETRRVNLGHIGAMRRYVRAHGIRVVHAHGYRSDLLAYAATRGFGRPALVTTHHGWIRNNPRQELMTKVVIGLCRRFDGVEVVSHRLLDELPAAVRRRTATVVHNAVVLDDYAPTGARAGIRAGLGLADDDVLLGVIGRISIEKGCLEMVDAFAQVAARHPRVHLAFIGEGPLTGEVEARAAAAGLGGRVRFLGHQTRVQPYYEAIDLLVSPSRTEGISNVILEALAFRRPVVATRVGGTPEILEDGVSGLLVPASEADSMAEAIGRVVGDRALYASLAAGGRRRIEDQFSFEARMRKEEAFYDRVLGRA